MELLAAPPAELAAIADPAARGAAPLLRPPDAGGRAPAPAVPFELLFELLTKSAPGGELWPAGGKKLPLPRLDDAAESAPALAVFTANGLAPLPLAAAPAAAPAVPAQTASPDLSALPMADVPAAAPRVGRLLSLETSAREGLAGPAASQPFDFELAAPVERVPGGAEARPVDAAALASADGSACADLGVDGLEALFSSDARVRAQLTSAAAADARASATSPAVPLPLAANVPRALAEANLPGARTQAPERPGTIPSLDTLAAIKPLALGSEAPAGLASDWLPAGHVHANGTAGAAAAAAPAPLPQAPVDARLPDWHEAFAQRVQWLVDTNAGEARIKLSPPELGAVDVKIALVDDKAHVHLTASTAGGRDELAQSLPRLRELFAVSGLELGSASVHDGRGGEHARPGGGDARHGDGALRDRALAPLAELLDAPAVAARAAARGRIDVFA